MAESQAAAPWKRQSREPQRAYAAFCVYRDLGQDRTLLNAARIWLTEHADRQQTKRIREQRRYAAHARPKAYLRAVRCRWGLWSSKWHWVARCEAYGDWLNEQTESERIEGQLRLRQEQIADAEAQARTRLGQLRVGRTAAGAFLNKLARAFLPKEQGGTGELIDMNPAEMVQHAGKVGSLLIGCIAEERRELAALGVQQGGGARPPSSNAEEVQELARELLAMAREQRHGDGGDD